MTGTTGALIGLGFGCAIFALVWGIVDIWRRFQEWHDRD